MKRELKPSSSIPISSAVFAAKLKPFAEDQADFCTWLICGMPWVSHPTLLTALSPHLVARASQLCREPTLEVGMTPRSLSQHSPVLSGALFMRN